VADTVRIKYRRLRVATQCTGSGSSRSCQPPGANAPSLGSGLLAWQSEGVATGQPVALMYRNIRIRLYPKDPLYPLLYGPTGIRDFRIQPLGKRPALDFHTGTLRVLQNGRAVTLTGRNLPLFSIGTRTP
jgi:hypothetical protein